MALKLRKWDSAEHLKTEEDVALYFEACLEQAGDDAAFIAKALGNLARARGMTQLAKETGMGRESLYKALSGAGNPSFATILKVTRALGLRLHGGVAQNVSVRGAGDFGARRRIADGLLRSTALTADLVLNPIGDSHFHVFG